MCLHLQGAAEMLFTLFAKLKVQNGFTKDSQTTLHNNLFCACVLEIFQKVLPMEQAYRCKNFRVEVGGEHIRI